MLVFQSSHVNDEVTWSLSSQNAALRDWAILQIESSMDFAHGNWWTTFLTGSLNYQAVHHLFPHVSQYYYPKIASIVQETCQQFGVKYNKRGSLAEVLALHINRLTNMGTIPGMFILSKSPFLSFSSPFLPFFFSRFFLGLQNAN
jgi:fatty acid desaturase